MYRRKRQITVRLSCPNRNDNCIVYRIPAVTINEYFKIPENFHNIHSTSVPIFIIIIIIIVILSFSVTSAVCKQSVRVSNVCVLPAYGGLRAASSFTRFRAGAFGNASKSTDFAESIQFLSRFSPLGRRIVQSQ